MLRDKYRHNVREPGMIKRTALMWETQSSGARSSNRLLVSTCFFKGKTNFTALSPKHTATNRLTHELSYKHRRIHKRQSSGLPRKLFTPRRTLQHPYTQAYKHTHTAALHLSRQTQSATNTVTQLPAPQTQEKKLSVCVSGPLFEGVSS